MTDNNQVSHLVVGIYVFNSKGETLLIRHPKWHNLLVNPGGHIEPGEKAAAAVLREIKEETGLDVKDIEFITVEELLPAKNYKDGTTNFIGLQYKAKLVDENQPVTLDPAEGTEYFWLKPEDALKRDDVEETVKEILEKELVHTKKKFFSRDCAKCEEAKKDKEEYHAGWQRALADYKNLQAEIEKRRGEWIKMSEADILESFIPVYDNFKAAFNHQPVVLGDESGKQTQNWIDGIGYIMKQFNDVLVGRGITEIEALGKAFDPRFHEAMGEEPATEGIEPGTVSKVLVAGYKHGDKVLRPAKIMIAK